ncbi:7-carboxy-7-deazaguanine synthase QueE [Macrococcus equipercicus]|uniref:7-carboxy-7-deazaguanine synthase n=1 Tax=Macrococcus equipercicus TaxID=69967 RepID=A0A9Q9BUF1_9STAP|nr:7-carboxy-7-deazaguanine synthase QueE [Macrococcus equipercicus]KAA1042415.1 7-carboxy-7-deazaguanine synthase QueE [Macrococcus equipercicus]UTH14301.1 7-carboxy-7-deazaguanine synthase QueE [Macrococcus equipercicus]
MKIPVMEVFGPTIQGEGMVIGRKTMFVRTAGCDFRCSWCDSKFTWDGTAKDDIRMMTAEDIMNELKAVGGDCFDHVTISGGNPALIKGLSSLVTLLHAEGCEVALETQGSKFQDWMTDINQLTLSPKPPSSGMVHNLAVLDSIINQVNKERISLKVVVFDDADYAFARTIHQRYPELKFYLQVGNPYLDETVSNHTEKLLERYEELIDRVMDDHQMNSVFVTPQLHTLLWSNKKGV